MMVLGTQLKLKANWAFLQTSETIVQYSKKNPYRALETSSVKESESATLSLKEAMFPPGNNFTNHHSHQQIWKPTGKNNVRELPAKPSELCLLMILIGISPEFVAVKLSWSVLSS